MTLRTNRSSTTLRSRALPTALLAALAVPALLSSALAQTQSSSRDVLWYPAPAPIWDHALPVGNGRLGAMVFGGANDGDNNGDLQASPKNTPLLDGAHTSGADEHLQLNEASLWHGSRADRLNPAAHEAVPAIRKLLLDSHGVDAAKIAEAEKLAQSSMIAIPSGMPGYSTLGDLTLRDLHSGAVTGYRRQLDLATGVVTITYARNGVHYTREIFASVPDDVIVVRLRADRKGALSFRASMDRPEDFRVETRGDNTLLLREGPTHKDEIRFAGETLILPQGGSLHAESSQLTLRDADSAVLLIAAATTFRGGPFPGGDPIARCEQTLAAARARTAAQLLAKQEAVYQPQFRAIALHLGQPSPAQDQLPTDERIRRAATGADDLGLQQLYFDFARYLLISSSRPDGLPANLQGTWAAGINNPWGSKWTINVNTEMNYWLAESAGMGQSVLPLINLIDMVRTPGSGTGTRVAQQYYGARGFVIHHNTDLWGDAEPIDGFRYGIWPMGGAWLSLHAWDHYAYTLDDPFLRQRAWPILHDASLFFLDSLIDDGAGHLVTGPSLSPENSYQLPDGSKHSLTLAPTMDVEILRELFTRTLDAGRILHEDPTFLRSVEDVRNRLPPFRVGRLGQLQEWQQDYEEAEPGHRHISHLWALFPGTQISLAQTPDLAAAARVSLERRLSFGGGQTGWSRAWVVNYWDHLHDAAQAYDSLQVMIRQSTFPNLMDTHPPGLFQIDGNLGAANGMLEAILQSRWTPEETVLDLLPALPAPWAEGSLSGLHVRGGAVVDLRWSQGRLTHLTLHAAADRRFRLVLPTGQHTATLQPGSAGRLSAESSPVLEARRNAVYRIAFP